MNTIGSFGPSLDMAPGRDQYEQATKHVLYRIITQLLISPEQCIYVYMYIYMYIYIYIYVYTYIYIHKYSYTIYILTRGLEIKSKSCGGLLGDTFIWRVIPMLDGEITMLDAYIIGFTPHFTC